MQLFLVPGLIVVAVIGVWALFGKLSSGATNGSNRGLPLRYGTTPAAVRRLVIAQAGWIVVLGLAAGLGGAFALRRAMATVVFGVPTTDPLAYAIACACLAAATLTACAIPANRAASMDPVRALRQE